ncbi:MAG: SLC13 family permease [Oscillospiraceae bacterium]|jgi:Na+/H+ antiporter NhaD/arsenite permease-like protein
MIKALAIFLLTYVLLMALPKYRAYIALASAALFVILGILPLNEVFSVVNWNVIMMIAGTMGVVYFFIESKMPALLADVIIQKMPNMKWAIIALSLFAGIISAFVDNVATVLMVAPVALTISKKLNASPVNSIIAISISANLQGAATLVGDTTSILLGGYAELDFLDFFVCRGRPGMFWVVEISAIAATLVLMVVLRKENQKIKLGFRAEVTDYFPTVMLLGTVVLLILASFIKNKPENTNGYICMALFIICLIRETVRGKGLNGVREALKSVDYFTLCLLIGLFIVVAGITKAGVVDAIAGLFVKISGNNIFAMYSLIVWASVLLSAFIDNIPYVATMLPVVSGIAALLDVNPTLLYFGLLSGATLGGNLTPIGASANIAGLGILRKEGYDVSTGKFMKISVPFTLSAVITGYLLVWFIWCRY